MAKSKNISGAEAVQSALHSHIRAAMRCRASGMFRGVLPADGGRVAVEADHHYTYIDAKGALALTMALTAAMKGAVAAGLPRIDITQTRSRFRAAVYHGSAPAVLASVGL